VPGLKDARERELAPCLEDKTAGVAAVGDDGRVACAVDVRSGGVRKGEGDIFCAEPWSGAVSFHII
jgi:hypothetical protein